MIIRLVGGPSDGELLAVPKEVSSWTCATMDDPLPPFDSVVEREVGFTHRHYRKRLPLMTLDGGIIFDYQG